MRTRTPKLDVVLDDAGRVVLPDGTVLIPL